MTLRASGTSGPWASNMRTSKRTIFPRAGVWLSAAAGVLLVWLFVELSLELFGDEGSRLLAIDRALLRYAASLRRGWLTGVAIDLTALGSPTVLSLMVVTALLVLAAANDRPSMVQLAIAAGGAGAWISVLKRFLERDRPAVVSRIVEVSGFSYPSGHTLAAAAIYSTLAILACRVVASGWPRGAVLTLAVALTVGIGASRVYLGVHYPSDVLAGLLVGMAWAFIVTAARFSMSRGRAS